MTPDEYTNQEFFLDAGHGHQLYVQDWGKKDARTPIIFLHGGPGSGCQDKHKQVFDPARERVIFYDQRGSGKSTPYGSLAHNTTAALVEDIELLAKHLRLERFVIYGGSWSSCLALAYALKYPARIKSMVLRGIFTGSRAENDYLNQGRWATHFPEVWDTYLDNTPPANRDNPTAYHVNKMLGTNAAAAKKSAYIYNCMDGALMSLDDRFTPKEYEEFDPTTPIIEAHYIANDYFLPERHILENAHQLTMPVYLIQGRYDFVCPPVIAYELHHKLTSSELIWTVSGHKDEREGWAVTRQLLLRLTAE